VRAVLNDLPHVKCIRRRYNQHAGLRDMGLYQHGGVGCVARNCSNSPFPQSLDCFAILLSNDVGNAAFRQDFADPPADPTVTNQNDLAGQIFFIRVPRQLG
jgi:hypothetical protein